MEENSEWKIKDNRFVAFLDILGFKEFIMRNSHDEVYEQLTKISNLTEFLANIPRYNIVDNKIDQIVYYKDFIEIATFSDSFIIFSNNDSIRNYKIFTSIVNNFYANALKFKIPLKGGFAHGEISIDKSKNIYFGQPIIDAFLLQEDVNYIGIVAHHSIDVFLKNNLAEISKSINFEAHFFEEKTPLKSGYVNHLNLNWFELAGRYKQIEISNMKEEDIIKHIEEIITDFKYTTTGSPRKYIDNTIDFFRESLKNKKIILLDSITSKK
ncbi:MAG: hypothetical protein ABI199_03940 [Bacteroidia bacterium]